MRILVIDQCSAAKEYPEESPVFSADELDSRSKEDLFAGDRVAARKARSLYGGRQQRYVAEAVDGLRQAGHDVDRYFISAGFGLVEESERLPPYEVTFNEMPVEEIRSRADELGISEDVQLLVSADVPYDLVFFAIGKKYYVSVDLDEILSAVPTETSVVLFNQDEFAERHENAVSIPARTEEAKAHGTIVVALKGLYLKNFADHVTAGAAVDRLEDVVDYCTQESTTQTGFDRYA